MFSKRYGDICVVAAQLLRMGRKNIAVHFIRINQIGVFVRRSLCFYKTRQGPESGKKHACLTKKSGQKTCENNRRLRSKWFRAFGTSAAFYTSIRRTVNCVGAFVLLPSP